MRAEAGETIKGTKASELRCLKASRYSDMMASWFVPGLLSDALNKLGGPGDTVIAIKVLAGILATKGSTSAAHRGRGGEAIRCRLCGKQDQ